MKYLFLFIILFLPSLSFSQTTKLDSMIIMDSIIRGNQITFEQREVIASIISDYSYQKRVAYNHELQSENAKIWANILSLGGVTYLTSASAASVNSSPSTLSSGPSLAPGIILSIGGLVATFVQLSHQKKSKEAHIEAMGKLTELAYELAK